MVFALDLGLCLGNLSLNVSDRLGRELALDGQAAGPKPTFPGLGQSIPYKRMEDGAGSHR